MNNIMTVTYAPGSDDRKPMIRIANRSVANSGFAIGIKYEVVYEQDTITIRKINKTI